MGKTTIGILQHTSPDVIESRKKYNESEWIMLKWLPELTQICQGNLELGQVTNVTDYDVRFYLGDGLNVLGYFQVSKIIGGPTPTLLLGQWNSISARRVDHFEGYRIFNHETAPNFYIDKDKGVWINNLRVGVLNADRYITWRNKHHYMRKFKGFGISLGLVKHLAESGINTVIILYTKVDGSQEAYYSSIQQWLESSRFHQFVDDLQVFLPTSEMRSNAN